MQLCRERGWDWREVIDLSHPVDPLGPSPAVSEAILDACQHTAHYPERFPVLLVEALAQAWGISPEQILPGCGVTELIYFLASAIDTRPVVIASPCPETYLDAFPHATTVSWYDPWNWPAGDIFILSNPNLICGRLQPEERLKRWLLGTRHTVIVDESLLEYTGARSCVELVASRPGLYVLRSLSGFYGLAGLRLGALVASAEAIAQLRVKRPPWLISPVAKAAALAALADTQHQEHKRRWVAEERQWMEKQLRQIPAVDVAPSDSNVILVYVDGAGKLARWLMEYKVLVKDCTGLPGVGGDAIRISLGTRAQNERLLKLLREYLCGPCLD